VTAKWEKSPQRNREFKYYRLSPAGRQHLAAEESRWNRMVAAIGRVMRTA
jgi:DNA-binding PadR family transcriptional regulator